MKPPTIKGPTPMHYWYTVLALLLAAFAAAGDDKPPTDLDRIQGDWRVVKIEDGSDKPPPPEALKEMWFTIKGDKITPRKGRQLSQPAATIKLDSAKKPKAIDLAGFGQKTIDQPGGPPKVVPNPEPVPGIYELDGDELRHCLEGPGSPKDRPKEFKALDKQRHALLVLRRIKQ